MNLELSEMQIGDLTVRYPIIQGGMGVAISLSGLAAAVATAGGIGVIATAGIALNQPNLATDLAQATIDGLREEIRQARAATDGVVGVNIMAALAEYDRISRAAMEEGVDVIFSGAGLPMNLPEYKPEGCKTKLVPIVSSGRAAAIIAKRWVSRFDYVPDALVLEGPLAGGHLGFSVEEISSPDCALERLLPDVLKIARDLEQKHGKHVPVIAAGGIYTGEDIYRIMEAGADGVQMATRFVTTDECDASEDFKRTYIACKQDDLMIIKSPVGLPGRAIRNQFLEDVAAGEKKPFSCSFQCIPTCDYETAPYCIAHALLCARRGNFENGFAFAGANAWRATEIIPVQQLMDELQDEYRQAAKSAATA